MGLLPLAPKASASTIPPLARDVTIHCVLILALCQSRSKSARMDAYVSRQARARGTGKTAHKAQF